MTNREFREVFEDGTAKYSVRVFKFLRTLPYRCFGQSDFISTGQECQFDRGELS